MQHTSRYGLRPRASSASSIERQPEPASYLESTLTEHVGSASPPVGGSLPHIELRDALSPQAGSQRDEVAEVDASQDGQTLPSTIEASQVLATVYTEDFSSSTPQGSSEDLAHPPDGDTTFITTQTPLPPSLSQLLIKSQILLKPRLFKQILKTKDDSIYRCIPFLQI